MKKYTTWITLIRPVNLLIVAAAQYALNIFLLIPNFSTYGIYFTLNAFEFFLLVLSTVLICAGGNIINDYYDIKADEINKPLKQVIGKTTSPQEALRLYWIFTAAGFLLGIFLAFEAGNLKLAIIQGICILLLYFYSYSYKRILLLGNVVIAFLTAVSILIVGIFEPNLYILQRPADYYIAGLCWRYLIGISIFAFLLTLVREIVKDAEDIEGDDHIYVKSIPIVWGITAAKWIAAIILFAVLLMCGYIIFLGPLQGNMIYMNYGIILLIALAYGIYLMLKANQKKDFSFLSMYVKLIMLLGILFLPVYYFVTF